MNDYIFVQKFPVTRKPKNKKASQNRTQYIKTNWLWAMPSFAIKNIKWKTSESCWENTTEKKYITNLLPTHSAEEEHCLF